MIDLPSFEVDNLVAFILLDMQVDFLFQYLRDDVIVLCLEQLEYVFSIELEVRIIDDSLLQFLVLTHFCNDPGVMNEFSSFLELRIHHNRHEVVVHDDPLEDIRHVIFEGSL